MRKTLLLVSLFCTSLIAGAQSQMQSSAPKIPTELKNKAVNVPVDHAYDGTEAVGKLLREPNPYTSAAATGLDPEEAIIGQTTYDLQTNSAVQNRVFRHDDGTISAVWTYSESGTLAAPDRGTGYNYFDQTSWGAYPTARIESKRTGWPSISSSDAMGEIVTAHTVDEELNVAITSDDGAEDWNEQILDASGVGTLWIRTAAGGGSDDLTVHSIAVSTPVANNGVEYMGQDGALMYSRSLDGGQNWDIIKEVLPPLDSNFYPGFAGDSYAISYPHDSIWAFVIGDNFSDLVLMKTTNNGDSFTKTVIDSFPYPMFDEASTLVLDTPNTSDGSMAVALDNNGMAHVVWGAMRVLNDDTTDAQTSYFPFTDGLCYWNESMGSNATPDTIAFTQDVNGNGTIEWLNNQDNPALYFVSTTGFPSMAIADDGTIYVTYAELHELLNNGTQNYRHIKAIKSSDGGGTWTTPNDVTPFEDFAENVFGSLAPHVDTHVHMVYQRDFEPGLAVRGDEDQFDINEIVYKPIPITLDVGVEENEEIIRNLAVYPNPASDITSITFSVTKPEQVIVNIYDIAGKQMASFNNNVDAAGVNKIDIDVADFASGVYLVNATVGEQTITKKLIVR